MLTQLVRQLGIYWAWLSKPLVGMASRRSVELQNCSQNGLGAQKLRGLALFAVGRFEESAAEIEQAIFEGMRDAPTLNTLGAALLGAKQPALAQIRLEEALSLDPRNRHAWTNLCRSLREQGLGEKAVSRAREALENLPPGTDLLSYWVTPSTPAAATMGRRIKHSMMQQRI